MRYLVVPVLAAAFGGLAIAQSPAVPPMFTPGSVRVGGVAYPYQLLEPLARHRSAPLPLVVYLHGAGERGDDNQAQRKWLPDVLATAEHQERWPCFVLAVQCPKDQQWVDVPWSEPHGGRFPAEPSPAMRAVLAAMDEVLARHPVDRGRVYLTGLSMGGYGCWDLAAREPQRFAAMLAVCGGGDGATAHRFVGLPICVYHGGDDAVVPVDRSRAMVGALRQLGIAVDYRELPGVGHDAWRQAYGDGGALDWLFQQDQRQQQRGDWRAVPFVPAPDRAVQRGGTFALGPGARCVAGPGAERAAAAFAAAVALRTGRELPCGPGEAGAGDVAFRIDPAAAGPIVVDVGAAMTVVVQDATGLGRAAVAAWQLLQAQPGLAGPTGTWTYAAAPAPGQLVLGPPVGSWKAAQVRELVAIAWSQGVVAIVGEAPVWLAQLPAADAESLQRTAASLGVQFAAANGPVQADPAVEVVSGSGEVASVRSLLAASAIGAAGGKSFALALPGMAPDRTLAVLRTRLPAVAERSHRSDRPIHVGGFLARLGSLLRAALG